MIDKVLVLSVLGVLHGVLGNGILLSGQCNSYLNGVPNFNISRYMGEWYEIERYPQAQQTGQCVRATYSNYNHAGNQTFDVRYTQVVSEALLAQNGTARQIIDSGKLLFTFNVNGFINRAEYVVLATDYDSYALVYSCRQVTHSIIQVSSWKLSRTASLSLAATTAINTFIALNPTILDATLYQASNQTAEACFYIPELNPYQEVRLRGNCSDIVGQANFDLARYVGWWHELSSYPTGQTDGTCRSSRYTSPSNNIFEFEDTEVFGLYAEVITGSVIHVGNGRLNRTWSNNSYSEDYWVMGTDYENYAVVLKCEDISAEYVRVWSSIQSKSGNLTLQSEDAISSVFTTNNFLVPDFFLPVNRSDEACFHYPEQTGSTVILPGQCDPDILVQPDFDITQFAGIWYQIERYPYPDVNDNSTCIGARYTHHANNTVGILNWEVQNGVLETIRGEATIDNATLIVAFDQDVNKTRSLHILATDYTTYSVALTCENVNEFQRAVVAFKLSRTRSLSDNASVAINATVASVQELYGPFFISVQHSDDCVDPSSSFLIRSSIGLVLVSYLLNMLM